MNVTTDSAERKALPLMTGCIDYFREALLEVAQLSVYGNDKHNPGQPLHWSKEKSNDHADCCVRHLAERGTMDYSYGADKPIRHSAAAAWRALANLQIEIEEARKGLNTRSAPEANPWREWKGGECPVPADTRVQLILSDGEVDVWIAKYAWWDRKPGKSYIMKWRYA